MMIAVTIGGQANAAPYAAMVIDARSGEVLHSRNADTPLHPASLTKMMTLYVVFDAVRRGEIGLDTPVKISKHAASEPPSKLGLRSGQTIALRYLIRAAAVKSANDAATALGEAIEGSEAAFARRMTQTAKAMGMTRTTFKNAHGLTEAGHLSTARDMTTLGRQLFYDFPEYYNLFSRRSTNAGVTTVANTNRRFLAAYNGADGIKTGYTRAAGFNLVASAERGNERIIATMFGGTSTAQRNAKVAELLDMGFSRAPSQVAISRPAAPDFTTGTGASAIMASSLRPHARPALQVAGAIGASETQLAQAVNQAVQQASVPVPVARPDDALEVVTRVSTSGGRHWGINVGKYGSRHQAESVLLKTALVEIGTLDTALRKVVQGSGGYEANFVGMTQDGAALACRRLAARDVECNTLGPTG
ncbi:D-alanyl-D-alanine carboxypeptidase family protein [Palleronia sp. LCG004]|uniref:D-alanyl-D-alanine carboxypeptidase family protein n=1 Tax=Palleronia sp. LCG004 TaxID=3079304 RepID=UPI0029424EC9|nr:D-alanyl-D-alanine carboxypeptidase family protein [Palleronia sp. LCG004]WOI57548.1 D-alanyl-D-alanine carboxypeptidase family protein [Palleronia sp. LCG004]